MNNFNFNLNNNSPLYLQIYNGIKNNIINNTFKYNDKLPSKRKYALDLNVSINTIMNAYNMLLEEGYIYSVNKSGYFINNINIINKPKEIKIIDYNSHNYKYDLTCENTKDFPISVFNKITREIINESNFLVRSPFSGNIELKSVIKEMLYEKKNMIVSTNQIFISNGGKSLINHIIRFLNVDKIAVEEPGFYNSNNFNVETCYINVDNEGIMLEKLKESNAKLSIVTSCSEFPLGIKMSMKRKNDIANYLTSHNSYIIEDAFDSSFRNQGIFSTPLFNLSHNVIYIESFSRTMFPGLNITFMVLPNHLVDDFNKYYSTFGASVSTIDQLVLARFIKDNYYDRHINKLRINFLNIKKELKNKLLSSNKIISINDLNYSSIIINYKSNKNEKEIKEYFNNHNIKINFLSSFSHIKNYDNYLIIGFTNIDKNNLMIIIDDFLNYL